MSVTLIIRCDRCSARLTEGRTSLKPVCGPMRHQPAVDLCSDCREAFDLFLNKPPAPDLCAPLPSTTQPRGPRRRSTAAGATT